VFTGKTALLLTVTGLAFAAGFTVAQTTQGTGRAPQFENADVKVWKSVVLPSLLVAGQSTGISTSGDQRR